MAEPDLGLFDRETIRRHLLEVAELLPEGEPHVIVVVGGSLLALRDLRTATHDVDSMRRLDPALVEAAATVARRHDLPAGWLNDRAAMFWPQTLSEAMCETVIEHRRLRVLAPPLRFVFAMKLEASRRADIEDLRMLWPHCGFASPDEAAALWRASYPHQEPDPHLVGFIRQVLAL